MHYKKFWSMPSFTCFPYMSLYMTQRVVCIIRLRLLINCGFPCALFCLCFTTSSSLGCFLRRVSTVLASRVAAAGDVRALAALVIPPRSCAGLLARCLRASGVSSDDLYRLLPVNTTSQSIRPARFPSVLVVATLTASASI